MLMLRFRRVGKTKQPTFRLIVNEKSQDTKGSYLELLGTVNPRSNPRQVKLNTERIQYWISKGAQSSPAVHNLLVDEKILTAAKVRASKSKPGKKKRAAAKA
ncbi:30S ribosomal protein S16 [Candidatus Uhrbacteria bacterium]|nr:30S ribosomal protein S16 [Candidatus Uhrbacteria bacterium]